MACHFFSKLWIGYALWITFWKEIFQKITRNDGVWKQNGGFLVFNELYKKWELEVVKFKTCNYCKGVCVLIMFVEINLCLFEKQ